MSRRLWAGVAGGALVGCVVCGGASDASALPSAAQDTHVLLIAGLGGEPQYTAAFHGWMSRFADAASEKYGVPAERIVYLAEDVQLDRTRVRARSTGDNVRSAFARLGGAMAPGDELVVLLAGHGTFRNGEARFNVPGPDLTPADFALLLDGLGNRRITLVNTTSASGPFVEPLSAPNRTIVAATRSGRERNLTRFGLHFVDAFAGDDADADKNGRVSMLEAFRYARREVEREYEGDNQLLTEHAVLDDNGDGEGSREPDPASGDGALAARVFLAAAEWVAGSDGTAGSVAGGASLGPEVRALYEEKAEIEARIEALRAAKEQMPLERYEDELEELLVELALKNRQIRAAGR